MGAHYSYSGTICLKPETTFTHLRNLWVDGEDESDPATHEVLGDHSDDDDGLNFEVASVGGALFLYYNASCDRGFSFGDEVDNFLELLADEYAIEGWASYEDEDNIVFYGPTSLARAEARVRHYHHEMTAATAQHLAAVADLEALKIGAAAG